MPSSTRKIAFVVPSFTSHEPSKRMLAQCRESVKGMGRLIPVTEPARYNPAGGISVIPRSPFIKYSMGWKEAQKTGHDTAVLLHHDTIVRDREALVDLIEHVHAEGIAFAGPRDGGTVNRSRPEGHLYLNTSLVVANLNVVRDPWWEDESFFDVLQFEDYWTMFLQHLGNILYLDIRWAEPRIGRATDYFWGDRRIASHLWLSMGPERTTPGFGDTIEGFHRDEISKWRDEWLEAAVPCEAQDGGDSAPVE
jgi:hypothetical protein